MTCPPLTAALLLADRSPCLRLLVLTELLGRSPRDPEVRELEGLRGEDPLLTPFLTREDRGVASPGAPRSIQVGMALARLGYLGLDGNHPAVASRAELLFSLQSRDGSWPLSRAQAALDGGREAQDGYDMIPLQTAMPLRGLAMCGYAEDPRAEKAYEWLESKRLPDGAWPTGYAKGVHGRVGGYRRLPQSRWGCRSNTTGALLCLAYHPRRRTGDSSRSALDHLLSRETRDRSAVGFEVARLVGAVRPRGFVTYHAAFDAALVLDLCRRVGASREDERVEGLIRFVDGLRGEAGLWELPVAPAASRWLCFDLLRSLAGIAERGDWLSARPRTPYHAYPGRPRRN